MILNWQEKNEKSFFELVIRSSLGSLTCENMSL